MDNTGTVNRSYVLVSKYNRTVSKDSGTVERESGEDDGRREAVEPKRHGEN